MNPARLDGLPDALRKELKEARHQRGWSQADLGRRIGLPQTHVSGIETGRIVPRFDTLLDLVRVLDRDLLVVPRALVPAVRALIRDHRRVAPDDRSTDPYGRGDDVMADGFVQPTAAYFCYVTTPSRDEALAIGRALVEERLAAAVNVIDGATSLYWWQGRLEQASEAVLTLRTRAELVERVIERIRQLHSYHCPCVVALPIAAGNPEYLDWIAAATAPVSDP